MHRARRSFQSTRPRGARRQWGLQASCILRFQSTRPRGARPSADAYDPMANDVSIHAPARGATQTADTSKRAEKFQSTRPRGARHTARDCSDASTRFQSTRPRGARPFFVYEGLGADKVSIHAPARGATREHRPRHRQAHVSIHAPARGATGSSVWTGRH